MGGPFWQANPQRHLHDYPIVFQFNAVHVCSGQMEINGRVTLQKYRVSGWHSSVIEVQVPATAKRNCMNLYLLYISRKFGSFHIHINFNSYI